MSSARDDIFAGVRRSLGVIGFEAPRLDAVRNRLTSAPAGPVPARGKKPPAERIEVFVQEAERTHASVAHVASSVDAPIAAARFLLANNLPANLRMGSDERLSAMPWSEAALDIRVGPSAGDDLNAVSYAFAGVAETGTLALLSGSENPTTLNFLADTHIVLLHANDVVDDFESLWTRLRQRFGRGALPRAINMVTGPSRSGDVEQILLLGAHGPRRLHIILVGPD